MLNAKPAIMALILLGLSVCLAASLTACGRGDGVPERQPGPMRVAVTIPPLKGLIEPLLPEGAQVYIVIPPGRSEHGYEFTPADVAALSNADVAVYIGLGLEPRIERFLSLNATPRRQVVSFAQVIGLEEAGAVHHHHEHTHDEHCDHGDDDPHIWLDPVLCAQLIPHLRVAVERSLDQQGMLNEAQKSRLAEAERELIARIQELHAWTGEMLEPHAGKYIVTHHAAWGRLADRYGLKVAAVIRPFETVEPTPRAISATVEAIRQHNVGAIFVEPQFNPAAAERIAAAASVRIALLDPLGSGDWFGMMRGNVESLAEALGADGQ